MHYDKNDFLDQLIYNKVLGLGTIIDLVYRNDSTYFKVKFENKISEFNIESLYQYCIFENNYLQEFVEKENQKIADGIKLQEEREKQLKIKKREELLEQIRIKQEKELKRKEERKQQLKENQKQKYIEQKHLYFETKHKKEFPYSTFLVYQGKTWEYESKDQTLCIHKDYDRKVAFWDIITELKCLDILLHCRGQLFYAISRVNKEAYETNIDDFGENIVSYKVNCDYVMLDNPIDLRLFREDIKYYGELNNPTLSPFNKHGLGNQGYIYPIDRDLAQAFINEATKQNSKLLDINYVKELLELYNK